MDKIGQNGQNEQNWSKSFGQQTFQNCCKAKQHGKTEVLLNSELEEPMKTSAKIQNIE